MRRRCASLFAHLRALVIVLGAIVAVLLLASTCARGVTAIFIWLLALGALGSAARAGRSPPLPQPVEQGCEHCGASMQTRTTHCARCGVCVTARLHHCSMLDVCIGAHNRLAFLMLLISGAGGACMTVGACGKRVPREFHAVFGGGPHVRRHLLWLYAFHGTCGIALALVALAGFHLYLVMSNRTPREFLTVAALAPRGQVPPGRFDQGVVSNCAEVFGRPWVLRRLGVAMERAEEGDSAVDGV